MRYSSLLARIDALEEEEHYDSIAREFGIIEADEMA